MRPLKLQFAQPSGAWSESHSPLRAIAILPNISDEQGFAYSSQMPP